MIQGFTYALMAGLLISMQNVFLSRTGEKIGFWETSTLAHGLGFLVGLAILLMVGRSEGGGLKDVKLLYSVGCTVGVFVVYGVVQGVTRLGVVFAVPLIIGAQVLGSVIISRFGLFDEKLVYPSFTNIIGIVLLVVGVILTQFR